MKKKRKSTFKILLFENNYSKFLYRKRKGGGVEFKNVGLGYFGVTSSWKKESDIWDTLDKIKKHYTTHNYYNCRAITKSEMALLI